MVVLVALRGPVLLVEGYRGHDEVHAGLSGPLPLDPGLLPVAVDQVCRLLYLLSMQHALG